MSVSPDKKQAVAVYYKVKATPNPKLKNFRLQDLIQINDIIAAETTEPIMAMN